MPIYEYKCLDNGHEFEVLQSIHDPAPANCKFCSSKVEKMISRTSFRLKGSGWYTTDYKKSSKPAKTETSDKPAEKKTESPSTDTSSDD